MGVTVAIRFPLGRYHATPWDRSANEGAVEWPPSPWRLLRALVATWYARWPDLPAPVLDGLLDALGGPPAYRTPPVLPGHTRHYLPDLGHRKGETGSTDLTLDPYLWMVPRDAELLVRWDTDLAAEQREVLGKLLELVPYLGRAESVCEAGLRETDSVPDETWWRPMDGGAGDGETVRLLAPRQPVRRPVLELSTLDVRRQRRTMPPETEWVRYVRGREMETSAVLPVRTPVTTVDAVRFAVVPPSRAKFMATHGVLLADEVHRRVTRSLDGGRREVLGYDRATTDHRHAHWVPITDGAQRGATVGSLLIWVPAGLTADEVAAIVSTRLRSLSGSRGGAEGYEIKGFPEVDLLLQAVGPVATVAPELCGPARKWRSLTPYLPVRHRKPKRETVDEFLATDLVTELRYRGLPTATVTRVSQDEDAPLDRWAREFRRYRASETMRKARPGLALTLDLDGEVDGPVMLGQLSHFGFGIFVPHPSSTGGEV
jgi:CRISPR-associated protein Csb2